MKTTKLILALMFNLALISGCSVEEPIDHVKKSFSIETVKLSKEIKQEATNNLTEASFRTPNHGPGDPLDSGDGYNSINTMELFIEYKIGTTTTQKQNVRNTFANYVGFISYSVCTIDPIKEKWTVNEDIYSDNSNPTIDPKIRIIKEHDDINRASETQNYCQ